MKHFRMLTGVDLPYERQGFIYFTSRMYRFLPPEDQEEIDGLCRRVGKHQWLALRDLMCTDKSIQRILQDHYIASATTLNRLRRKYYREFPW